MKHLLDIESLAADDARRILLRAAEMKQKRGLHPEAPLRDECWALMFSKSSTRTRLSFEVGIRELGGQPVFLAANDIQLGRGEPIRDTARVMGRMVQGAVIRTYAQSDVEEFAKLSGVRTINALTDEEHPCQILSDLFTITEKRGGLDGLVLTFIGDGDCNMARSWIWASARLGFELRIASPARFQPPTDLVSRAGGKITVTTDVLAACAGADVLYTDVWVSMGKEDETAFRTAQFAGYQINRAAVDAAGGSPLVMHCLPAYRGKEITDDVFEANAQTIFDQAENRLHTQKAVLTLLEK
ncbi:MAG: ornithine carbamoyltransferase [Chthoniobacterales bacterium]|jgi:ornithine carbamoyltransferase